MCELGRLKKTVIILYLLMQVPRVCAVDEVTFSAGAPLDSFQGQIIISVLNEAFKRNGIKFNAEYNPSLRSLERSNTGRVDGELHRVYDFHRVSNHQYPNLIRIESKLLSVWVAAFAKENIKIKKWSDLKDYRVVYYLGRKNVETFLGEVVPKNQILAVSNDVQAFQLLAAKRADVVISESINGQSIIKSRPVFNDIKEVAKLNETSIYAYFHKKHRELSTRIAKTLDEMKKEGSFIKMTDDVIKNYQ